MPKIIQLHATAVSLDGRGLLLRGPSGSGKSDLALRLIQDGYELIADDRVDIRLDGEHLLAAPPLPLAGKMEVRSLGIIERPYRIDIPLMLVIDLVNTDKLERLPEPMMASILGQELPLFTLSAFESSVTAKVHLAAGIASGSIMRLPTDA